MLCVCAGDDVKTVQTDRVSVYNMSRPEYDETFLPVTSSSDDCCEWPTGVHTCMLLSLPACLNCGLLCLNTCVNTDNVGQHTHACTVLLPQPPLSNGTQPQPPHTSGRHIRALKSHYSLYMPS